MRGAWRRIRTPTARRWAGRWSTGSRRPIRRPGRRLGTGRPVVIRVRFVGRHRSRRRVGAPPARFCPAGNGRRNPAGGRAQPAPGALVQPDRDPLRTARAQGRPVSGRRDRSLDGNPRPGGTILPVMTLRGATAVVAFALCVAVGAPAAAQSGRLAGVVVDATGGVLPGATVALRGGPGGRQETQADARGRFAFSDLAPGEYTVTVFLSGFGEVTVDAVAVGTDPVALPPITLRLGAFADATVVTATRIEEPLQEVPLSISAVTGADIESRAIDNLTDLARWTPGLTVVDQGARGSNVVVVRGLHTDALNGSEAAGNNYNNGVATYLGDHPAGGRPPAARHRAGGGTARAAGDALRRRHARRRGALPAAPPGHGAPDPGRPRRPVRPLARGRSGRRRRRDLQPAARRPQAGPARLRRPLRELRLHRLRLPRGARRASPSRSRT